MRLVACTYFPLLFLYSLFLSLPLSLSLSLSLTLTLSLSLSTLSLSHSLSFSLYHSFYFIIFFLVFSFSPSIRFYSFSFVCVVSFSFFVSLHLAELFHFSHDFSIAIHDALICHTFCYIRVHFLWSLPTTSTIYCGPFTITTHRLRDNESIVIFCFCIAVSHFVYSPA